MPWIYEQSTGVLLGPDGTQQGVGYSGLKGVAQNNAKFEHIVAAGPIPRGLYAMAPARTSRRVGPLAIDLRPILHDALGRSALMIHGDNPRGDRSASNGCVILGRFIRQKLAKSRDREFEVV